METVWRSAYESKKIVPVLQTSLKSDPKHRNIPLAISYAKTEEARELLKIADNVHVAQFPFSVPPGMIDTHLMESIAQIGDNRAPRAVNE